MRTLLFVFIATSLSAQLTTSPKIIYKANKSETVTASFSPSGEAWLSVKAGGEVIDEKIELAGYRVHTILLDSGETIIAMAKGIVGYTIYRNGVNVTPAAIPDNTFAMLVTWINGLTAAQRNKLLAFLIYENPQGMKKFKEAIK